MGEGILSIQSAVAYGHVGNSAAVFPLQRLGFEVWPVNTVQFSNHTGYGAWRGHIVEAEQISEILQGLSERDILGGCLAVVSGYLGDAALGELVLDAVSRVRAANPAAIYACDPVMGDEDGGFYVRDGIPEFFRDRALATADLLTPNHFELAWLAGQPIVSIGDALNAAISVRRRGPKFVVATSLVLPDHQDELVTLAVEREGAWAIRSPRLPISLNGTGDAFTALILGNYLRCRNLETSLRNAVASMYGLVEATSLAQSRELELVQAQDQIVAPTRIFSVERVA